MPRGCGRASLAVAGPVRMDSTWRWPPSGAGRMSLMRPISSSIGPSLDLTGMPILAAPLRTVSQSSAEVAMTIMRQTSSSASSSSTSSSTSAALAFWSSCWAAPDSRRRASSPAPAARACSPASTVSCQRSRALCSRASARYCAAWGSSPAICSSRSSWRASMSSVVR